ncbi:FecR family protein [Mucilaginibacter flavus]|uniref:FecR family protein n=1 Tax=Mucilaginibacter flavus TaxID=931504 RepID=UPI0025B542D4|nr:FecR domain-containing protein [Mucilaginibacter flavus]MDN3580883.1 FecR domain-containing protein [Mucilaginibacter flavus]
MAYNKTYIQELIIERVTGTISAEDDSLLETAIQHDEQVKQMWDKMQQELNTSQTFFNNIDENSAWDKIAPQISNVRPIGSRRSGITKWISIAALLCISIGLFFYWQPKQVTGGLTLKKVSNKPAIELQMANGQRINLSDTGKRIISTSFANLKKGSNGLSYQLANTKTQEWSTLMIPPKLNYQIVLSDGTEVWMNSASSLRFPFAFTGQTRDVYLSGEAFFKVAKNKALPFIVHTNQTDIKVLGTQFNVNTYKQDVTTTSLVEGSVTTNSANTPKVLLQPGYQAVYAAGKGFLTQPFEADVELAWMHDIYYFHDTKLQDIGEVLSRWFDVKVVFDDPAKAHEAFSGAIEKNRPIEVFIQNIKTSAGVKTSFADGVLHIK